MGKFRPIEEAITRLRAMCGRGKESRDITIRRNRAAREVLVNVGINWEKKNMKVRVGWRQDRLGGGGVVAEKCAEGWDAD